MIALDASAALSWSMDDELDAHAATIFEAVSAQGATVPPHFWLETSHNLLKAVRRGRIGDRDADTALALLVEAGIVTAPIGDIEDTVHLARRHELSTHDAAYLELALRRGLQLATRDQKLRDAATAAGCAVIET